MLGLLVLVGDAGPARAHTSVVSTTPTDGAVLTTAPVEVTLEFDDDVRASVGGVRVFGPDGERVDAGPTRVDGATAARALDNGLASGTYLVAYLVLSADDHPVQGAFVFSVGEPTSTDSIDLDELLGGNADVWSVVGALARFVTYLTSLYVLGAAVNLLVVHRSAPLERTRLSTAIAAAVGAFAALVALPVTAAVDSGEGTGGALDMDLLGDVATSDVGLSALLTVAGLLALTPVTGGRGRRLVRWLLLVAGGGVLVTSFTMIGHPQNADQQGVALAANAVHVGTGAVWFGGLLLLGASSSHYQSEDPLTTARAVSRFSTLAAVSVLALIVAGSILTLTQLDSFDEIVSTTYGATLASKLALAAVVLTIAAHNRWRLVPAISTMSRRTGRAVAHLRHTVRAEVLLLVLVLGVTALLVGITPPTDSSMVSLDTTMGEYRVRAVIEPARAGSNEINLFVIDAAGRRSDQLDDLQLRLTHVDKSIGPIDRQPLRVDEGHYVLTGTELALAGSWRIELLARPDPDEQLAAAITVAVTR